MNKYNAQTFAQCVYIAMVGLPAKSDLQSEKPKPLKPM